MDIVFTTGKRSELDLALGATATMSVDELDGAAPLLNAHNYSVYEQWLAHHPDLAKTSPIPNASPQLFYRMVERRTLDRQLPQAHGLGRLWWVLREEEVKQVLRGEAPGLAMLDPDVLQRILAARP